MLHVTVITESCILDQLVLTALLAWQAGSTYETDPTYQLCQSYIEPNTAYESPSVVLGQAFLRQWLSVFTIDPQTLQGISVAFAPAAPGLDSAQ